MNNPSELIVRLDLAGISATQAAYDYLLDRWGTLVGTFRAAAISACFAFPLFQQFTEAEEPLHRLVVLLLWGTVFLPLIGLLLVRPHLDKENKLQQSRRYLKLNGTALLHREGEGLYQRLVVLGLIACVHLVLSTPDAADAGSVACLIVWLWARAVMVRDRDEARFAAPRSVAHAQM